MTTAASSMVRMGDRFASPPGWLFNAVGVAAFVWALVRGSERTNQIDSVMSVAAVWFFLLLAWAFRLAAGAGSGTVTTKTLARWAVVPVLFGIAAVLVFGDYALKTRFELSRSALDAAAARVEAGEQVGAAWLGLYPVDGVTRDGSSIRVRVHDQFSFVRDAPPSDSMVYYKPISGPWSMEIDTAGFD